jgi:hypothetical protein
MIKSDPFILEFVSGNLIAIGLFLGFLKGIAKITKSTIDDKIVTLITNLFSSLKTSKGK